MYLPSPVRFQLCRVGQVKHNLKQRQVECILPRPDYLVEFNSGTRIQYPELNRARTGSYDRKPQERLRKDDDCSG
jgi:hypothetical protein